MKTMAGWNGSGMDLGKYLQIGDAVDQEMADYFLCVLPPAFYSSTMIQIGEPNSHVNGRPTFSTVVKRGGVWHYAGNCFVRQATEPQEVACR